MRSLSSMKNSRQILTSDQPQLDLKPKGKSTNRDGASKNVKWTVCDKCCALMASTSPVQSSLRAPSVSFCTFHFLSVSCPCPCVSVCVVSVSGCPGVGTPVAGVCHGYDVCGNTHTTFDTCPLVVRGITLESMLTFGTTEHNHFQNNDDKNDDAIHVPIQHVASVISKNRVGVAATTSG